LLPCVHVCILFRFRVTLVTHGHLHADAIMTVWSILALVSYSFGSVHLMKPSCLRHTMHSFCACRQSCRFNRIPQYMAPVLCSTFGFSFQICEVKCRISPMFIYLSSSCFESQSRLNFFYFELSCFPTIVVIVAKPLSAIEKATAAMVTMHTMKKRHDGRNKRRRSDE
jgi:hypothetical protein